MAYQIQFDERSKKEFKKLGRTVQKLTKEQRDWLIEQFRLKIYDNNRHYNRNYEPQSFWDKQALTREQINDLINQCTEGEDD